MSDTLLETICINGTRPPYKRPAWVIGQVGSEELQNRRAQTATSRERQNHSSHDKRRPKSTPCRLNVSFNDSQRPRCSRWRQVYSARNRGSLDDPYNDIDDLTLFLEEERLNHKFNLRKAEEDHQLHIEQITEEHREHIKWVVYLNT
ncbi:unnamed protein product [Porites evermanni]|uniref:Uncharacterized protein n=1 Tax=Porites evermanni TaxID=104178 RepID=A0ABN8SXA8_9CNID|nr:unnamed protein product [Porites evermanni]